MGSPGDPAAPQKRHNSSPPFSAHVYCGICGHGRPTQLLLSSCLKFVYLCVFLCFYISVVFSITNMHCSRLISNNKDLLTYLLTYLRTYLPNDCFIANLLLNLALKEFWKSVNIWLLYGQDYYGVRIRLWNVRPPRGEMLHGLVNIFDWLLLLNLTLSGLLSSHRWPPQLLSSRSM